MNYSITDFTKRCRLLQSLYREEIHEPMGVGPWKTSKKKQISMIANGEKTGRNFVNPFTFDYAKQRVEGKKRNETIDEYRLFNNLLSSQPMKDYQLCFPRTIHWEGDRGRTGVPAYRCRELFQRPHCHGCHHQIHR